MNSITFSLFHFSMNLLQLFHVGRTARSPGLEPVPTTLTWPMSDDEARKLYTSTGWANKDELGAPRVSPSKNWDTQFETVPKLAKLTLLEILGDSDFSAVYSVEEGPWAIKYHAFCPDEWEPLDSVLVEAYFLQLIADNIPDVTHRVKYLSAGFSPAKASSKLPFITNQCPGTIKTKPVVRFLVTEIVGWSIQQVLEAGNRFTLTDTLAYGIRIFSLLEKLHMKRVIHADIHSGNLAYRGNAENADNLILIDFGRARIVGSDESGVQPRDEVFCHAYVSPWEATSKGPPSFRDDAFRTVITLASMVFGIAYAQDMGSMCRTPRGEAYREGIRRFIHLRESNLFDLRPDRIGEDYPIRDTSPATHAIRRVWGEILDLIRITEYSQVPDYRTIITKLTDTPGSN
jgi:hypothetical protein